MGHRFRKFTTKNTHTRITAFAFLFDFTDNANNTIVHPVASVLKEQWFLDAISGDDTDLFLIIGHTPVRFSPEFPLILEAIRKVHGAEMPVQFFGGHTHIRDFTVYDEFSTGLESGRYCETVGWLSISHIPNTTTINTTKLKPPAFSRTYIDFNRFSFTHHSHSLPHPPPSTDTFDTPHGLLLSSTITTYRHALHLDRLYGCIPSDYYLTRVPSTDPTSIYSLLQTRILPDLVRSPARRGIPTVVLINTGCIRFDLLKGRFDEDARWSVSPFTSKWRFVKGVPGEVVRKLAKAVERVEGPWVLGGLEGEDAGVLPSLSGPQIPLGPIEAYYEVLRQKHFSSALLHHSYSSSGKHPHHPHGPQQFLQTLPSDREIHLRRSSHSPGYITPDDLYPCPASHSCIPGDDTPHIPIPTYSLPRAIIANHSFPPLNPDIDADAHVDVVFLDFIEPSVLAGLQYLGWDKKGEKSEPYKLSLPGSQGGDGDEHVTLTDIIVEWIRREWPPTLGGGAGGEGGECLRLP